MRKFLLFICFFPFVLSAQDKTMDSLKIALRNAKHDTTRILVLNELSALCAIEDLLAYAQLSASITKKHVLTESSSSLKLFYKKYYSWALNNIGFVYHQKGDIANAISNFKIALDIQKEISDSIGMASSLNNLAYIFESQGDIYNAIDLHHQSLKISESRNDSAAIETSINNIGIIYRNQNEIKKAYEYFMKAVFIEKRVNDLEGLSSSLNNLGAVYLKMGDIDKSFESYIEALKIGKQIKNKDAIATALNNLGILYKRQKKYALALEHLHNALIIEKEFNEQAGSINTLNNIARVNFEQGNEEEAYKISSKNLIVAKQFGYPEYVRDAASLLKVLFKNQGNFKDALEMYELELQMQDSLSNQKTKHASIKKQFQYEYEKKAAADSVKHIEEQKIKNALVTAQQAQLEQGKIQRFALYGGLVLVLAFLGFVFNRFKVTQKQKVIIEQQKLIVDAAFEQLHEKNKEVMDSITYARRIQRALITSELYIEKTLNRLTKNV